MAYGEGGKSTGYGGSSAGTGGYASDVQFSSAPIPDYDYVVDLSRYYTPVDYFKGERKGSMYTEEEV